MPETLVTASTDHESDPRPQDDNPTPASAPDRPPQAATPDAGSPPRPRPLPPRPVRRRPGWRRVRLIAALVLGCWLPVTLGATALSVLAAQPAAAAVEAAGVTSLNQVITNIQVWLTGLLAGLATLFVLIGGARYLAAGGDPGEMERAKAALKSAAYGYALALLAPIIVSIVGGFVGA